MCGIVGYVGEGHAKERIIDGLKRLEYRGYDSAGLAVRDGDGETDIIKAKDYLNWNIGDMIPQELQYLTERRSLRKRP